MAGELGRAKSEAKSKAARANGKLGGRPKKHNEQGTYPNETIRAGRNGKQVQRRAAKATRNAKGNVDAQGKQ